jgi:hypothetical protein
MLHDIRSALRIGPPRLFGKARLMSSRAKSRPARIRGVLRLKPAMAIVGVSFETSDLG